jgi:hypothetical protein
MENIIYKLEVIVLLRKAVLQCYNSVDDTCKLIECISLIDELEEEIVSSLIEKYQKL